MPATYEPIATTTVGTASSTIVFNGIPGTYTDLVVVLTYTVETNGSNQNVTMRFNSDTGTNYSRTVLSGGGTFSSSSTLTSATGIRFGVNDFATTVYPELVIANIFSYAGSTYKSVLSEVANDRNSSDGVGGTVERSVGLWRSTSAITSITLLVNGLNFAVGSKATIFGITKA